MAPGKTKVGGKPTRTRGATAAGRTRTATCILPAIPNHPLWEHATRNLQSKGGRLDANLVASVFGLSQKELADLLGLTVKAMRDNPDAEALQNKLRDFQRIARLRILPSVSAEFFRKWLRSPLQAFKSSTPLEMLRHGKGALVAELVENAVTSQPS